MLPRSRTINRSHFHEQFTRAQRVKLFFVIYFFLLHQITFFSFFQGVNVTSASYTPHQAREIPPLPPLTKITTLGDRIAFHPPMAEKTTTIATDIMHEINSLKTRCVLSFFEIFKFLPLRYIYFFFKEMSWTRRLD